MVLHGLLMLKERYADLVQSPLYAIDDIRRSYVGRYQLYRRLAVGRCMDRSRQGEPNLYSCPIHVQGILLELVLHVPHMQFAFVLIYHLIRTRH